MRKVARKGIDNPLIVKSLLSNAFAERTFTQNYYIVDGVAHWTAASVEADERPVWRNSGRTQDVEGAEQEDHP